MRSQLFRSPFGSYKYTLLLGDKLLGTTVEWGLLLRTEKGLFAMARWTIERVLCISSFELLTVALAAFTAEVTVDVGARKTAERGRNSRKRSSHRRFLPLDTGSLPPCKRMGNSIQSIARHIFLVPFTGAVFWPLLDVSATCARVC